MLMTFEVSPKRRGSGSWIMDHEFMIARLLATCTAISGVNILPLIYILRPVNQPPEDIFMYTGYTCRLSTVCEYDHPVCRPLATSPCTNEVSIPQE